MADSPKGGFATESSGETTVGETDDRSFRDTVQEFLRRSTRLGLVVLLVVYVAAAGISTAPNTKDRNQTRKSVEPTIGRKCFLIAYTHFRHASDADTG